MLVLHANAGAARRCGYYVSLRPLGCVALAVLSAGATRDRDHQKGCGGCGHTAEGSETRECFRRSAQKRRPRRGRPDSSCTGRDNFGRSHVCARVPGRHLPTPRTWPRQRSQPQRFPRLPSAVLRTQFFCCPTTAPWTSPGPTTTAPPDTGSPPKTGNGPESSPIELGAATTARSVTANEISSPAQAVVTFRIYSKYQLWRSPLAASTASYTPSALGGLIPATLTC